MKKTLTLLALSLTCLLVTAQETNTWRLGVQSGWQLNRSKYSGGMADANARFHQSPFGAFAFDIIGRYDFNNHWMIQSGLNFNRAGFEFALAENYSFTQRGNRFTKVSSTMPLLEIPIMVSYKFKPNCNNWKWIATAGIANVFTSQQSTDKQFNPANDGASSTNYLSSTTTSKGGSYLNGRLMIGREKVFGCGSILQASFIWNIGFTEMAHATVKYTVDGQAYQHEFSNKGNFVGFRVAYFLRPLSSFKKKADTKKAITSAPLNAAN
ncbi:MAG TPA: outer membrane beta-barrel protein [Bacteroidia bacterium]|jgi:hypothetical protein|nr:outer membrane beta-barrel protein [Bacteroidia bacterium]